MATAVVGLTGCAIPQPRSEARPDCCKPEAAGAPLPDRSLYQLESTWTNDAARPVHLAELRGRPQVLLMFFASCQYACPMLVYDLKRIEKALPPEVRAHTDFLLVSFDTERDTPVALADYRVRHQLPADRWRLLRGQPDDVLELAALLGVKFKKDANGQFSHSNVITVLDAEGELVHQRVGLNGELGDTIAAVTRLTVR